MARVARVRWSKDKRRWFARIGEVGKDGKSKRVFAPAEIGQRDEDQAWEWLKRERSKRATVPVTHDVTTEWVCEHYLAWAEGRRDAGRLAEAHYVNKELHLGLFCEVFGSRIARTLEPDDLTRFLEGLLSDGHARSYVRNIGSTVRTAMNWAVRSKHLDLNPIAGYTAPTLPRSPIRFAERAEAGAFLGFWRSRDPRGAKGRYSKREPWRRSPRGRFDRLTLLLVRVLIRTGARPGELCKLKWSDIQWESWTTSSGHKSAKAVIPPDRWKAGEVTGKPRTIYLTPLLSRALRRVRDRDGKPPHPEWVFVHSAGRGGQGSGQPWADGSRLSRSILYVRRALIAHQEAIRASIEAGGDVPPWERRWAAVEVLDEGPNRLTNYRWRHTAISTLLMMGVEVPTVAELVGTSPQVIYQAYGHLLDQHLASAAEKLAGPKR